MKVNKHSTREQLLNAAHQVILHHGAPALTLDAVAQQAGVSKGGLLYHFPSKEALIIGMIDRMCDAFDRALEQALAQEPELPGRYLRAYVQATFMPDREALAVGAALNAATANNPALLEPVRERFARWQAHIVADGLDPALASIVRLAADGLWFADFGQFAPIEGELRAQVLTMLIQLTQGEKV